MLWYMAQLLERLGGNMDDVPRMNLNKLADRAARGMLEGSGDAR